MSIMSEAYMKMYPMEAKRRNLPVSLHRFRYSEFKRHGTCTGKRVLIS